MAWKKYKTLDKMLKRISYSGNKLQFDYVEGDFIGGTKYSKDREFVQEFLKGKMEKTKAFEAAHVYAEMTENLYKYGLERQPERKGTSEVYLGSKGVVFGTIQQSNFLSPEKIALIYAGKKVPSIADEHPELRSKAGHGRIGWLMIRKLGSGIFIDPKKMEIYVSVLDS